MQNFEGEGEVFVGKDDLERLGYPFRVSWPVSVSMVARVTERHTGVTQEGSTELDLVTENLRLKSLFTPRTYKPGLNYTAYVREANFFRSNHISL